LRKLLKQLEKTRKITRKLWGVIILGSPKERQIQVSKSIWFPFLIFKKKNKRMICNKNKKHRHIKRSLSRSRPQRKSTFPTRSTWREQIDKQWLQICMGRRCKLTKIMRLGIFYSYRAKL
jgi:hypothetical protein